MPSPVLAETGKYSTRSTTSPRFSSCGNLRDGLGRGHQLRDDRLATGLVHLVHDDARHGPVAAPGLRSMVVEDVAVTGSDRRARLDDGHDDVDAVGRGARGVVESTTERRLAAGGCPGCRRR